MSEKTETATKTNNMNFNSLTGRRRGGPEARLFAEKPQNAWETLKRLIIYIKQELPLVIAMFFSVLAVVLCTVFAPKFQSSAIDKIADGKFDTLPKTLIIMACIYILQGLATLLQTRFGAKLSQRVVCKLRQDLFEKIVKLPIKYFDNHPHGDMMSRMTNDVDNVSNTVSQHLCSIVSGILTIIGTIAMMLYYCWQLTLLSCTTIILTLLVTKFLSKLMRKFFRKRQILLGVLNATVEEMVTGYKTVVVYNRQEKVISDFNDTSDDLKKTGIIADILGGTMGPLMTCINNIGFVIIALGGGYFAIHKVISIGVISAFIIYAKQMSRPINEIAQVYAQIQTAIAGAERVFSILDEPEEDKSGDKSMEGMEGVVTFDNVNFSYYPGKQVLYDFNFKVQSGYKVALVGATGSGKTTVVNLLMRFYDIDSGAICIDGVNIKDIGTDELRRNTAIVLQDTVLFSDTVRNNICYSNPDATDEQVEVAMKMCGFDKTLRHMRDGYNTMLTESGANLSQGQRQLLSIGRAFLADPKILILDEATSSVDTRTEKDIQNAMTNLMKNRTSIIIAHRLSTIQDADVIIVMDNGRIVETGDHKELISQKGKYYELYMTQFAGNAT